MNEIQEVLYRLHQGTSQRSIEKSLKISRKTIARILFQGKSLGFTPDIPVIDLETICQTLMILRKPRRHYGLVHTALKDHHDQIQTWHQMPHMTVTQMVRLFGEEDKKVSESSLRRYIKIHFPKAVKTTVHLEILPGSQAQVDFAYVGMMKDSTGKLRKAYAFIMILSYSRYRFVRFVFNQDVDTWIDCHIRAFHFFGGVPETIVLDNLKAGVTSPDFYDPVSNRIYGELERHYGFIVDPAKVRMPRHKGKVERSVTLMRQQILAGRTFKDCEAANEKALEWCRHEISSVVTTTTGEKPYDRYMRDEKHLLKPLPALDYICPDWQSSKVHRDQHIVFQGSFYSVPCCYVGQLVWVRAVPRLIEIFYEGQLIKRHVRAHSKGQWTTDKTDYPQEKRLFLEGDKTHCLEKAQGMGKNVSDVITQILSKESLTTQRKAQAILRLADTYGPKRLDGACGRSLSFDNLTYKGIKSILVKNLDVASTDDRENRYSCLSKVGSYLRPLSSFSFLGKGASL